MTGAWYGERGFCGLRGFAYWYGPGHWAVGLRRRGFFVRFAGDGHGPRGNDGWMARLTVTVEARGDGS